VPLRCNKLRSLPRTREPSSLAETLGPRFRGDERIDDAVMFSPPNNTGLDAAAARSYRQRGMLDERND
jgi:hypothetical protein